VPTLDETAIAYACTRKNGFNKLRRSGITEEHFVDDFSPVWRFLTKTKSQHDAVPSPDLVRQRFPDLDFPMVRNTDMPMVVNQIKQRHKYIQLLRLLNDTAIGANSWETVDEDIQSLQGSLNSIAFRSATGTHLIDLFTPDAQRKVIAELHRRRSGRVTGMPTGLRRLDAVTGGLQRQKMSVVIGRTGGGKSWLNLFFVANAIKSGHTFILYPLEMTLYDTAFRLYTIFSHQMFGADKAISNLDLMHGKVTKAKIVRLMHLLEDRFAGRLLVADVGSLSDPYTIERIDAEVELHRPDGFWVDYITLMKAPGGKGIDDWGAIRVLSQGIKGISMRRNTMGGCSAQVNREALRQKVFLPRLEHISYGDSIGQDSDLVVSINRPANDPHLYYALVKHRGGPEFGKTRVKWDVDSGDIGETAHQDPDGSDEGGVDGVQVETSIS
jgi:replicative DNA helicase